MLRSRYLFELEGFFKVFLHLFNKLFITQIYQLFQITPNRRHAHTFDNKIPVLSYCPLSVTAKLPWRKSVPSQTGKGASPIIAG